MRRASAAQAVRDVVRHCHSGLDLAGLRQQVLRSLRRLMPVDAAFFATADPETLLFTGGRYNNIMGPMGLGDELRAALVAGSECWGYLCLHRADGPLGFTQVEAELIARVGPHIAHALRQATLLHGAATAGDAQRPGVVLLADDLSVVASTPDAEHLLSLVDDDHSTKLPLPVVVYSVAAALGAVERGTAAALVLPSVRVRTTPGHWLNVHASRLQGPPGEDRIAVVVEPAEPRATTPLLLSAHGLTVREVEVGMRQLRRSNSKKSATSVYWI